MVRLWTGLLLVLASLAGELCADAGSSARLHVLTIGVAGPRYAVADAKALAALFADPAHVAVYPGLQLQLLDRDATLSRASEALEQLIRAAQPQDIVVISLSSDGLRLSDGALPRGELVAAVGRIPAQRVLVLLNGKHPEGGPIGELPAGRVVITATTGDEVPVDLPDRSHGAFVHHLIEGLRGAADGAVRRDNVVEVWEAWSYLQNKLSGGDKPQHPTITPSTNAVRFPLSSFPLAAAAPGRDGPRPSASTEAPPPADDDPPPVPDRKMKRRRGGLRAQLETYLDVLERKLAMKDLPGVRKSKRYQDLAEEEAELSAELMENVQPGDDIAEIISAELTERLAERRLSPLDLFTEKSRGPAWPANVPDPRAVPVPVTTAPVAVTKLASPVKGVVGPDGATMRQEPRHAGAAVKALAAGDKVVVTEALGAWYRVKGEGADAPSGFLHESVLDVDTTEKTRGEDPLEGSLQRISDIGPTYFFTTREESFPTEGKYGARYYSSGQRATILDGRGNVIAETSGRYFASLMMEGSGTIRDGRTLNILGPASRRRFSVMPDGCKGLGSTGNWLIPFHTLAVNPMEMPYGGVYYVPKTKGLTTPDGQIHDGYWFAHDTGAAFTGAVHRMDMYVDRDEWAKFMERNLSRSKSYRVQVYRVVDRALERQLYDQYKSLLGKGGRRPRSSAPSPSGAPAPVLSWVKAGSTLESLGGAVTNAQYMAFLAARPEWLRDRIDSAHQDGGYLRAWPSAKACAPGSESEPVRGVSWFAAKAFANWVGGRLPTEVEWASLPRREASRSRVVWCDDPLFHLDAAAGAGFVDRVSRTGDTFRPVGPAECAAEAGILVVRDLGARVYPPRAAVAADGPPPPTAAPSPDSSPASPAAPGSDAKPPLAALAGAVGLLGLMLLGGAAVGIYFLKFRGAPPGPAPEPWAPQAFARLVPLSGGPATSLFSEELIVGSAPETALLKRIRGEWFVFDKSKAGTSVNGARITARTALAHGSVVTVGAAAFRFELPPGPA